MRQAGRYMPSYQALRKEHSLGALFRSPKLIAEVTLLPIEELDVDAAIIFSDILLLLETLGSVVHYPDKGAPWVETMIPLKKLHLQNKPWFDLQSALHNLERLDYLFEGIREAKKNLMVPLFGFCAAPFTLLCYLLDREDRKAFPNTFALLEQNPTLFKILLDQLCELSIHYANRQIKAGIDLFQVFESSGSVLSSEQCLLYSIPYLEKISQSISVPCISFVKGACKQIDLLKASSLQNLSFDWDLPMKSIRDHLGNEKLLQGNLDPNLLFQSEEVIEKETRSLLESMKGDPRFILNLGHGIMPGTPYEHVVKFIKVARDF